MAIIVTLFALASVYMYTNKQLEDTSKVVYTVIMIAVLVLCGLLSM